MVPLTEKRRSFKIRCASSESPKGDSGFCPSGPGEEKSPRFFSYWGPVPQKPQPDFHLGHREKGSAKLERILAKNEFNWAPSGPRILARCVGLEACGEVLRNEAKVIVH